MDPIIQLLNEAARCGDLVIPGQQGPKGDLGEQGPPGSNAPPVEINIGRVISASAPEARITKIRDNSFILDLCLPVGPQGDRGFFGLPGKDAPEAKFVVGKVVVGSHASAEIRKDGDTHVLDLCLPRAFRGNQGPEGQRGERGEDGVTGPVGPRGSQGERGSDGLRGVQGERGERGPEGKKGERGAEGERGAQGVMGPAGESIAGPRGEATIISEEDLKNIFIRVLSESGVLSEAQARLIAVRAELRRALHQATVRHQGELEDVYRRVDNIIG